MNLPITGDFRPLDPALRKRTGAVPERGATGTSSTSDSSADRATIFSPSPDQIKHYVQILKLSDPRDLHRVEVLRERIRSGEYQADPEEMAGHLADMLAQERPRNNGA